MSDSLEALCRRHVPVGNETVRLRYGRVVKGLSPAKILDAVRFMNGSAYAVFDAAGHGFIAVGSLEAGHAERMADLAPTRPTRIDAGRATGPTLLFGGAFASEPNAQLQPPWSGWHKAEWRVPETVFTFCSGSSEQIVTGSVNLTADTDVVVASGQLRTRSTRLPVPPHWRGVVQRPTAVEDEGRSQWCRRVGRLRTLCAGGTLEKVVTARAVRHDAPAGTEFWLGATFDSLRRRHPQSKIFAVVECGHAFVGATPEILARQIGSRLETHALAGTAPRGFDARSDTALGLALLQSDKDRREHQIVVDSLRASLGSLGSDVQCGPTALRRLTRIQHLETPLTAQVDPDTFLDAVDRLHPTPALGGSPRRHALTWLAENEPLERGWFGGPIGWQEGDEAECLVAIRSALLHGEHAWTFAGAGIVSASNPDAEWDETTLKLQTAGESLRLGRRG